MRSPFLMAMFVAFGGVMGLVGFVVGVEHTAKQAIARGYVEECSGGAFVRWRGECPEVAE